MSTTLESARAAEEAGDLVLNVVPEDLEIAKEMPADRGVSGALPIFELYVDDDRYSVPTLHLVAAVDDVMALEIARTRLDESRHHCGVELWRDGRRLAALGEPRRLAKSG